MMQWFGADWGAPICRMGEHIPTPVGEDCGYCDKSIATEDRGLRMPFVGDPSGKGYLNVHHLCFCRVVQGSGVIVHALLYGLPLCGFSREVPGKWPDGHKWVYVEDKELLTCDGCKEALQKVEEKQ